jgi:hypothetical protein
MSNYQKAIEVLKTSTSVEDWNNKRDQVKKTLTRGELALIDGSGLIVQTLKKFNDAQESN